MFLKSVVAINLIKELEKLGDLKEKGLLTEEEFSAAIKSYLTNWNLKVKKR